MSQRKINLITALFLLLGLGSALVIFLTAEPVITDPLLGDPLATKKYTHELRLMGGEANVLASEFQEWFAGLWHGQRLAGTIAVLTIGLTCGFRFVATHSGDPDVAPGEEGPRASG